MRKQKVKWWQWSVKEMERVALFLSSFYTVLQHSPPAAHELSAKKATSCKRMKLVQHWCVFLTSSRYTCIHTCLFVFMFSDLIAVEWITAYLLQSAVHETSAWSKQLQLHLPPSSTEHKESLMVACLLPSVLCLSCYTRYCRVLCRWFSCECVVNSFPK